MTFRDVLSKDSDIIPPTHAQPITSDWHMTELGFIVKGFISGGTPSTKELQLWDGPIPWTTSALISEDAVVFSSAQRYISELALTKSATNIVPRGNLLVGTRVGVGKAVVNLVDIAISQDLTGVLIDKEQVFAEYLALLFKTKAVQQFFESRERGTTIKGISRFDLAQLPVCLPPIPEQRAIARVLRTVQDATQARRRELELERERKAALMHHLFIYGTRGEPTKQTEIGEMPEGWKLVELQSLCKSQPQNGAFIKDPLWGSGVPFVNVADIYRSPVVNVGTVQKVDVDVTSMANFLLETNDILFVRSSLKREGVGHCCIVPHIEGPVLYDCHLIRLKPNYGLVDPRFLAYFLLTERGRKDLVARSKTTTMTTLNQNSLIQTLIPLPSLSEQREISSIMHTLDEYEIFLEGETELLSELFHALLEELMSGRLSTLSLIQEE
jgi:type I restriction enzyme, S subunit